MNALHFYKTSGSGNDFIIVDNRENKVSRQEQAPMAAVLCQRKLSVGADGMIFLEHAGDADFAWQFYNADGSVAEMCGNGARCAARVAHTLGIAGEKMAFNTLAGKIQAEIKGETVKVRLTPPSAGKFFYPLNVDGKEINISFINTGVPHVVLLVEDIEKADVRNLAPLIRYHDAFAPEGTNVNFAQMLRGGDILLRTYERGVEDETLACGTGAVATALVRTALDASPSPVRVTVRSGEVLLIHIARKGLNFQDVYLEGEARIIYEADLDGHVLP